MPRSCSAPPRDGIIGIIRKPPIYSEVPKERKNTILRKTCRFSRWCSLLLSLCLLWSCSADPAPARLHEAGDTGYIPLSDAPLEVEIDAPQAFVYDREAGELLYKKGADTALYPASTAKLLTILYALTLLEESAEVTPGDELELVREGSSSAYVRSWHTLTVEMLVEGMLLPSGNDAAYALAAAAGRVLTGNSSQSGKDAVAAFMDGMNAYAAQLGMCGSHFTSPDGYMDAGQYSTLEDMALLAALAVQNPLIMRYAGLTSDDVVYASGHTNTWLNTNQMLHPESRWYDSAVTGLKTGTASSTNFALIVSDSRFIVGVFTAASDTERYASAAALLAAAHAR